MDNEAALIAVVGDQPSRNQFFFIFGNVHGKDVIFFGGEETIVEEMNALFMQLSQSRDVIQ